MVKKRAQKAKRRRSQAKASGTSAGGDDALEAEGPAPPQHVLRKLAKQQQFMQKIVVNRPALGVRSSLSKKRARQKRKPLSPALGDLSLLSASLKAAAAEDSGREHMKLRGLGVGGAKQRTRITDRETARLQQVLAHPQFKADPVAAITAHLAATLPPPPPAPKPVRKQQPPGSRKARQRLARQVTPPDCLRQPKG